MDVLTTLAQTQGPAIEQAADLCGEAIAAGGLVHLFGTGHSRIPVEEMFPRYGSYPGFHPIVELSTTFHTQVVGANGQRQAMFIERVEGLAEVILSNFRLGPPDVMIVFSASGLSANPIEMAIGARRRGLPVVAVTSLAQSDAGTPTHSSGTRLHDHADVVIDLCTPPADALVTARRADDAGRSRLVDRGDRRRQRDQGADGAAPPRSRRNAAGADQRVGRRRNRVGPPLRRRLRRTRPPPGARAVSRRARRSGRPRQAPGRGR